MRFFTKLYNIFTGGSFIITSVKKHDQTFQINAVKYVLEHPDLTMKECASNLGVGLSTHSRWKTLYRHNNGVIPVHGSGNYASDEQKEIARPKRELRDAKDALDVLKKAIRILGKN